MSVRYEFQIKGGPRIGRAEWQFDNPLRAHNIARALANQRREPYRVWRNDWPLWEVKPGPTPEIIIEQRG